MRLKKLIFATFVGFFLLFSFTGLVFGESPEEQLNNLTNKIEEYRNKLNELAGQKKTLSTTIGYLDTQVKLTEAEINKTEKELEILQLEILDLTGKIESLNYSLDDLTKIFIGRVKYSYKQRSEPVLTIFSSRGFPDLIRRVEYYKRVQDHDKVVLIALEKSRLDFDHQKQAKELKQAQVEALQKKLESQRNSLSAQKAEKQTLLDQTKSSETEYQKLLDQALAEARAIERALVSATKVGPVKKGDPIALVGNSGYPGCSTGAHLHFEVRKDGSWVDPGGYLSSHGVLDEDKGETISLGSGSWDWPIQDTIRLTQHYGKTPYSWRYSYSGGNHTGYDMVSTSSDVIRAPADGTLYSSSQSCGSSSTINIRYIDHGGGVMTFYLHVQ